MLSRLLKILLILFALVAALLGLRLYQILAAAQLVMEQRPIPSPRMVGTISFGASRAGVITVNSYTSQVFAAQEDIPALAELDARTDRITHTLPTRGYHTGIAINEPKNEVYVSQEFSQTIRVMDGTSHTVLRELDVPGGSPLGEVEYNADRNYLYVIQNDTKTVAVLDYRNGKPVATLPIDAHYGDLTLNSQTQRLYISSPLNNQLVVVDTTDNRIVATIPTGRNPKTIAVNLATNRVYVAVADENVLAVIDGTSHALLTTIPVGKSPTGVAVNPLTNRIFVTNLVSQDLTTIDGNTNTVLTTLPLGMQPLYVAVLPDLNRVYVTSAEGNSVIVVQDTPATSSDKIVVTSDESGQIFDLKGGNPPANWNQPEFEDESWSKTVVTACMGREIMPPYEKAEWIWLAACTQGKQDVLVRKTFELPTTKYYGVLRVRADDTAQVYVNGRALGGTRLWTIGYWYNITPFLREGTNVLAMQVQNELGYGMMMFRADLYAP